MKTRTPQQNADLLKYLCARYSREENKTKPIMRWADLREADLCGADLSGADLCGAIGVYFVFIPGMSSRNDSLKAWLECDGSVCDDWRDGAEIKFTAGCQTAVTLDYLRARVDDTKTGNSRRLYHLAIDILVEHLEGKRTK